MSDAAAIPDFSEYAWHLPCPQCDAEARQPCHAPRKQGRHDRVNRLLVQGGYDEVAAPEYGFMHNQRAQAGARHRSRDIGAAPWPEDRVPGTRYDTIDRGGPRVGSIRPSSPNLVLDPDLVERRGRAVLGSERGSADWPSGLHLGTRAQVAVGRATLVSWADHYGVKASVRARCCTRWLTRPAERICRVDSPTRRRQCWDGGSAGMGWREHMVAWTTAGGQPAALTAAPYSSRSGNNFGEELDGLVSLDDRLAWTSGGEGWYGLNTQQVIVWRRDLLGDVETADLIREAVLASWGTADTAG
ncbi:hypothetical protein [Streptomyces subrutilus]|uniref:hypothetical protein n=1 Tax=Streptomyces subrutilus TaxID=36818 RepID=UPI0033CCF06E